MAVVRCCACQSDHTHLTGETHYWIDAEGGWRYHELRCDACGARLFLDAKGCTHLLPEAPVLSLDAQPA